MLIFFPFLKVLAVPFSHKQDISQPLLPITPDIRKYISYDPGIEPGMKSNVLIILRRYALKAN